MDRPAQSEDMSTVETKPSLRARARGVDAHDRLTQAGLVIEGVALTVSALK